MNQARSGNSTLAGIVSGNRTETVLSLGARLGIPVLDGLPSEAGLVLRLDEDGLALIDTARGGPGPVRVDFTDRRLRHRLRQATPRREGLARAVGLSGRGGPHVLDATGGLGQDAFVLATLGARVTVLERHPVVYELLHDGLARAARNPETAAAAARVTLVQADAIHRLTAYAEAVDTIYLDPMYPPQTKGGEVKKGIRSLQRLMGRQDDVEALFEAAWTARPPRLTIKRPNKAPAWRASGRKFAVAGRHTRFDVYLPQEL